MKSVIIVAGVAVVLAAAVGVGIHIANVMHREPRSEAADSVRFEARQTLSWLNEDPAVLDPDPRRAEAAAKTHLHYVYAEETRTDGFTISLWFTTDWYILSEPQQVVKCAAYVGERGAPLRLEGRTCPPDAGGAVNKEVVTLDG